MFNVHMSLQGKGGVGKSTVSSFVVQYLLDKQRSVLSIDTDPVNASLAAFPRFECKQIELLDGNVINTAAFDEAVELVLGHEGDVVIDNGSSSFIPLGNYMIENPVVRTLEENDRRLTVHVVITGGAALGETLAGLSQVVENMPDTVRVVAWLNEYFGPIVGPEGQTFEEMKVYQQNKGRITGLIHLPRRTAETFGRDLREMLERHQTFAEAIEDKRVRLMAKQRLQTVRKDIYQQLDVIG